MKVSETPLKVPALSSPALLPVSPEVTTALLPIISCLSSHYVLQVKLLKKKNPTISYNQGRDGIYLKNLFLSAVSSGETSTHPSPIVP